MFLVPSAQVNYSIEKPVWESVSAITLPGCGNAGNREVRGWLFAAKTVAERVGGSQKNFARAKNQNSCTGKKKVRALRAFDTAIIRG